MTSSACPALNSDTVSGDAIRGRRDGVSRDAMSLRTNDADLSLTDIRYAEVIMYEIMY